MGAFALSLIRTGVPIIVGALVAWLATIGLNITSEGQSGLIVFLTGLFQAIYYVAVRLLEQKFPQIGVLLGSASQPVQYLKAEDAPKHLA